MTNFNERLDEPNIWGETEYNCQHCGGDDVVKQVTNSWKVYFCNDCESQTPLSVEDIIKEANL